MSLLTEILGRKLLALLGAATFAALVSSNASAFGQSPEEITARVTPVGQVCVAGQECAVASAASAANDGPRTGEQLYNKFCTACHSIGVANAPKFGNADDWAPRIAKGFDSMLSNALNGLNAMPARGTCADCSDDEIKGAIEYMVDSTK